MIEIKDLSFSRGGKTLFDHVTLTVYPGKKVGLIGANGTGKSSFFSLLLKHDLPDKGDISLPDKYVVAHVEQEISNKQQSLLNYVLQGDVQLYQVLHALNTAEAQHDEAALVKLYARLDDLGGYDAKHKAEILLAGLGFKPQQLEDPISSLSGGWQMRLNLARALMCPSDLLLLDEPTNHLDLDTIIWLEEYLKAYQGTLLVISHDREFLDNICNGIMAIANKQISFYNGNYSSYEQQYAANLSQQQAQAKKTEQRIAELTQFITRFKAKASKAKQAQSRVKALNKLELIAPFQANRPIQFSFKNPEKIPHGLLQLENVCFGYNQKQILNKVNFKLFAENRIGILGVNGAGKSTLVKIIIGQNKPESGHINHHKDIKIGYFAQDFLEQLDTSSTPIEQYKKSFPQLTEQDIRNHLGSFGFSNEMATQTIENMSGGEKARLALSIIVCQRPNLLILDEPTNHLDLDVRESLTFALQSFEGALLLVSHDRHLLETVCDEFYLLDDGSLEKFSGDLEDYRRFIQERNKTKDEPKESGESKSNKKVARQEAAELRKKLQPLTSELKKIESALDKLNQEQESLNSLLASPELYEEANKTRLKTALTDKANIEEKIEDYETRWMEISEELEALKAELN